MEFDNLDMLALVLYSKIELNVIFSIFINISANISRLSNRIRLIHSIQKDYKKYIYISTSKIVTITIIHVHKHVVYTYSISIRMDT